VGLALVKSLVDLHGGNVIAASDGDGLGSTFSVELPLGQETPHVA
jgi:signal transduction histidine kinase